MDHPQRLNRFAHRERLAEQKGTVLYYREAGQTEVPPQAAEVIKAVIENRLPIRLSSRADYSDAIGLNGRPLPGGLIAAKVAVLGSSGRAAVAATPFTS